MIDLPAELWLLIASFLPHHRLSRLRCLNSLFLNYWMDIRWECVIIDTDYPVRTVRQPLRMVDPFVATRVKNLSIHLLIQLECPSEIISRLTSLLLSSLPLLLNITRLRIGLSSESSIFFPTLFRTITSSSLPTALQRLEIYGHINMFDSLVEYPANPTPFENLTELHLGLDPCDNLGVLEENLPNLSLTLVPFLHSLPPTLQILRVSNWSGSLDLFAIFNTIDRSDTSVPFPNLKSLLLFPGFAPGFPKTLLKSVHRFLLTHSNDLQHFHLMHMSAKPHPIVDGLLAAWLAELVDNDIQFPVLRTLQLYPSINLSAFLTLVKRTAPTLSSLTIPYRYLTGEEVDQLLDALTERDFQVQTTQARPSKLRVLCMNVIHLSVPFLDLLARKLPQLVNLTLCVFDIVGSDQKSFYDLLHQRRYGQHDMIPSSPTQDILHTWELRYLSIWKNRTLHDAMHAVAGAVPSLRSLREE